MTLDHINPFCTTSSCSRDQSANRVAWAPHTGTITQEAPRHKMTEAFLNTERHFVHTLYAALHVALAAVGDVTGVQHAAHLLPASVTLQRYAPGPNLRFDSSHIPIRQSSFV
jgi:hypothetical protein